MLRIMKNYHKHTIKIALFIIFSSLGNISLALDEWTVRSSEKADYVPLMDLVSSINKQEWTISGYVDPDSWKSHIFHSHTSYGRSRVEVEPGLMSDNQFELFKLDCEFDACKMKGKFHLKFFNTGAFFRLEPRFYIDSYEMGNDTQLPTSKDYYAQLIGQKIVHEQPVKYIDRANFLFDWDPDDTWYPEQILVSTEWQDRNILRDFIKTCYDKCRNLRVFGEISVQHGGYGDLAIDADRLEKMKPKKAIGTFIEMEK